METIQQALTQIGVKEIRGIKDNPEILKYFNEMGFNGTKLHDETAWCSAFVNWVCKECGLPTSGKLTARSWQKVGEPTTNPKIGDIAVFWREHPDSWKGHVAFFIRETDTEIFVLGGNQNNEVSIKAYPIRKLLSYRKLN